MHYIVAVLAVACCCSAARVRCFFFIYFWFSFVCSSLRSSRCSQGFRFDVRSISSVPIRKTTNSASVLRSFDFFVSSCILIDLARSVVPFHFVRSGFFSLRLIRFSFGSFDLNWFLLTICFYCIQNWSLCCFSPFRCDAHRCIDFPHFSLVHLRSTLQVFNSTHSIFWIDGDFMLLFLVHCFCLVRLFIFDWAIESKTILLMAIFFITFSLQS